MERILAVFSESFPHRSPQTPETIIFFTSIMRHYRHNLTIIIPDSTVMTVMYLSVQFQAVVTFRRRWDDAERARWRGAPSREDNSPRWRWDRSRVASHHGLRRANLSLPHDREPTLLINPSPPDKARG